MADANSRHQLGLPGSYRDHCQVTAVKASFGENIMRLMCRRVRWVNAYEIGNDAENLLLLTAVVHRKLLTLDLITSARRLRDSRKVDTFKCRAECKRAP